MGIDAFPYFFMI